MSRMTNWGIQRLGLCLRPLSVTPDLSCRHARPRSGIQGRGFCFCLSPSYAKPTTLDPRPRSESRAGSRKDDLLSSCVMPGSIGHPVLWLLCCPAFRSYRRKTLDPRLTMSRMTNWGIQRLGLCLRPLSVTPDLSCRHARPRSGIQGRGFCFCLSPSYAKPTTLDPRPRSESRAGSRKDDLLSSCVMPGSIGHPVSLPLPFSSVRAERHIVPARVSRRGRGCWAGARCRSALAGTSGGLCASRRAGGGSGGGWLVLRG